MMHLAAGPLAKAAVTELFAAAGISTTTGKRARKGLGVESKKVGFEAGWELSLPSGAATKAVSEGDQPTPEGDHLP